MVPHHLETVLLWTIFRSLIIILSHTLAHPPSHLYARDAQTADTGAVLHIPRPWAPFTMLLAMLVAFIDPFSWLAAKKLLWLPKTFGRIFLAPWLPVKFADFWVRSQCIVSGSPHLCRRLRFRFQF
jgi:hypothetical protein